MVSGICNRIERQSTVETDNGAELTSVPLDRMGSLVQYIASRQYTPGDVIE